MTAPKIHLHEEVLLIALRDREGTIEIGSQYATAMAGATLAELLLTGRIAFEDKRQLVSLEKDEPFGDPILDDALDRIASARRRASLQTWVSRLTNLKKLKERTARELVRKGVLRVDEDKVLGLFKRTIYPERDSSAERAAVERMRRAIFTAQRDVDPRTVVLISLAQATGLLKGVFDKKKLRDRKQRIERVVNGELCGRAAKEVIEATQAAVMVAVMVPVIVSSTS